MKEKNFTITKFNNSIILEKEKISFSVNQAPDNDIWFETSIDNLSFDISFVSEEFIEWQTYNIFYNLLKSIIGRYFLNDDSNIYSNLPEDFIDGENKTITWHSDSEVDNILQLQYLEDRIRINMIKDAKKKGSNKVRIRTNGSDYNSYYQEFTFFYQQLLILEQELNKNKELKKDDGIQLETSQRKLTFFKKLSHKKSNNAK